MEQYIFNTAAMKCLCISKNYLHAKLVCKRSITSYWQQAVQHCNVSDATLSRPCSTAEHRTIGHANKRWLDDSFKRDGVAGRSAPPGEITGCSALLDLAETLAGRSALPELLEAAENMKRCKIVRFLCFVLQNNFVIGDNSIFIWLSQNLKLDCFFIFVFFLVFPSFWITWS